MEMMRTSEEEFDSLYFVIYPQTDLWSHFDQNP